MEHVVLILVGVLCLPLTLLGIRSMFTPRSMGKAMSITPQAGPARDRGA